MKKYWYGVQVYVGKEEKAVQEISQSKVDVEVFLPKRVMMIRKAGNFRRQIKPLFSGYLFLTREVALSKSQAQQWIKLWQKDRVQPVIFNILDNMHSAIEESQEVELVQPISQQEIQWILDMTNQNDEIEVSRYYREGTLVHIVSGPLKGQEARIKKVDPRSKRIKVEIFFLGQTHLIDLAGEQLQMKI